MMTEDLEFALERLADESRPVHMTNLAALSDVPRSKADLFRTAWAGYSPKRRLELVQELVEQAESNIHLNFYAILRELLADPDAQVRKLAIDGLWEDNRATLVTPLIALTRDDPEPEVRAAAAMSLGRFVLLGALGEIPQDLARQAEAALRAAWNRSHEVNEVRRRALEGLACTNDADVQEMIHMAYYDEDVLLRQSALFAMGRTADRRWAKYVLAELASRDVAMRFESAVAAGELMLSAAVPPLIRLLDDPDSTVRGAAASALGQIGGTAARRALEAAAGSSDEDLVEAAEAALEELSFNSGNTNDPLLDFGDRQLDHRPDGAGEDEEEEDEDYDDDLDDLYAGEDALAYDEDIDEDVYAEDDEDAAWLDEDDEYGDQVVDFEADDR